MCCLWQDLSHVTIILTLWSWPWNLTYFWKTLTLVITLLPEEIGLSYFTCVFLVTLTLKFDILLKNFNHGFYLVMVAVRRASLSSDNSYYGRSTVTNKESCKNKLNSLTMEYLRPLKSPHFLDLGVEHGCNCSTIEFWCNFLFADWKDGRDGKSSSLGNAKITDWGMCSKKASQNRQWGWYVI